MNATIEKMEEDAQEWTANRLRQLRGRSGLSMQALARKMGYAQASSIQRYEQPGGTKSGYLNRDFVAKLEKALVGKGNPPISISEVWELAGPEFRIRKPYAPNAVIAEKIDSSGQVIPVYGSAVGGIDGEFVMNGNRLYEVLAPPNLKVSNGAYAVLVSGDSMEPRYFDGETVFVDPTRRPHRGDFVVAQIQYQESGPILAFVKRFVRHNDKELVLEQFNPAKELKFEHKNVHSVHYIAMGGRV